MVSAADRLIAWVYAASYNMISHNILHCKYFLTKYFHIFVKNLKTLEFREIRRDFGCKLA